ncbi:uncharacterized protein LOC141726880 [Zonotrichia albicollis]|uniref:uncharacterized protein LOC141726880 n=1 Tax=Zonotrichia albicollis TaxID=44394 RepID=UPI003D80EE62
MVSVPEAPPPLPAPRPPPRPAPPARPPLRVIPSPPLQAVPPTASPASLPASENAETALPMPAELLGNDNGSPASGSAEEEFSPAPPALPLLPPASSPPQAETVPVQDGAGDGAEPAGPTEQPVAAPTPSVIPSLVSAPPPPAPAAPAVLPLLENLSSMSASEAALEMAVCLGSDHPGPVASVAVAPATGLSFHGAGGARQLGAGAVCLPAFKISILDRLGGVFLGIVPWRLPSLPPLLRPSGGGQVHPESSASGPQPGGGGDEAMGQMRDKPDAFALQGKRAQTEKTIAGLLWETNISRPQQVCFRTKKDSQISQENQLQLIDCS